MTATEVAVRRVRPLTLRRVTATQAMLARCCGLRWPRRLELCDRSWILVCEALEHAPSQRVAFDLAVHAAVWRVTSTPADLQLLIGPWIGDLPVEAVPYKILLGMLQDLASAAFGGTAADVRSLPHRAADAPVPETSLRLALHATSGPPAAVALWVSAPDATWRELSIPASPAADLRCDAGWGHLPLPARIELGWCDLPLTTVRGLRAGDVVLGHAIAKPDPRAPFVLRLSGHLGIHCVHLEQGRAKARGKLSMIHDETATTPDAHDDPADDEAPQLDELPVRLTFDLGTRTMLLKELQALHEGHVFDLGLLPRQAVTIRLNGHTIGEGELVDIDGRVGVEVIRMKLRPQ